MRSAVAGGELMRKHGGAGGFGQSAEGRKRRPEPELSNRHMFSVEALEPRLLLSADLNVAAGSALVSGLQALDSAVHNLANSTALSGNAPFISRNLADLAGVASSLGPGVVDPFLLVEQAASTYFSGNKAPTLAGLATALDQISVPGSTGLGVTATPTLGANGANVDEINLSLTVTETPAAATASVTAAGSGNGQTLSGSYQLTQTTTEVANLVFGVDMTSATAPAFDLMAATLQSQTAFANANLRQDPFLTVDVGGTQYDIVSGALNIYVGTNVALTVPGGSSLSTQNLTTISQDSATKLAQDATIAVNSGHAVSNGQINGAANGPSTINLVGDNQTGATDQLEQVAVSETAGPAATPSFTITNVQPSAFAQNVGQVISDLTSEISSIESQVNSVTSSLGDLPLIGHNLQSALDISSLLQPITNKISDLQSQLKADLDDPTYGLLQLQTDIANDLTAAGLVPAGVSDPVDIWYQSNGNSTATEVNAGTVIDLNNISQLEIDLTIGQTKTTTIPLGGDLGIPGLGLSMSGGSIAQASIGWSVTLGLGMTTASGADGAYLVAGNGANQGSPVNFSVGFTLGDGFQATGTMGFFQALVTEQPLTQQNPTHTGVTGSIGLNLTGGTAGGALNSGTKISLIQMGSLSATPTLDLVMHSNLQIAFGGDFQQVKQPDGTTIYEDKSDYPSLSAQFQFDWTITDPNVLMNPSSIANSAEWPTVGLNDIQLNLGTTISNFLMPALKPIYDATDGMLPVFQFLVKPVPIISDIVSVLGNIPGFSSFFPSYQNGQTYDWVDMAFDLMADFEGLPPTRRSRSSSKSTKPIRICRASAR